MDINRQTAGELLGLSVRTIDRYIRRGKLSARIGENGRIWLDKKEVMDLPRIEPMPINIKRTTALDSGHKSDNVNFYQDLYEDAKKALNEYQQKLEQANYRIGQLESRIINPISTPKVIERHDDFALIEREKENILLKEALKKERTARIIFAVLTYILLTALPLIWYLLRGIS